MTMSISFDDPVSRELPALEDEQADEDQPENGGCDEQERVGGLPARELEQQAAGEGQEREQQQRRDDGSLGPLRRPDEGTQADAGRGDQPDG